MHFDIIWVDISEHAVGVGIGLVGFVATISIFLPKNSKLYKLIKWMKKK